MLRLHAHLGGGYPIDYKNLGSPVSPALRTIDDSPQEQRISSASTSTAACQMCSRYRQYCLELIAQNVLLKARLAGKPEELDDAATEQKGLYLPHKNGNGYYCGLCNKNYTRNFSTHAKETHCVWEGGIHMIVQPTVEKETRKAQNHR